MQYPQLYITMIIKITVEFNSSLQFARPLTRLWTFTRLSGVLGGGATWCSPFQAVDGDWLVNDEESADHIPFVWPQQSYTVQNNQQNYFCQHTIKNKDHELQTDSSFPNS